jgi:predicted nucleic acid-binding protein
VALYLDTSCILKLLWPEPETARTEQLVRAEDRCVVSDLAWLETKVRIQSRHAAGLLTRGGATALLQYAQELLGASPFERSRSASSLVDDAIGQVDVAMRRRHCRTLDRLHLASMAGLGLSRLLTNDDAQARIARETGIAVLLPR